MMVSVTMAAFKYLNDSDYPTNTRIFIMNHAKERVMDKNTDLKNFLERKKESEKLKYLPGALLRWL